MFGGIKMTEKITFSSRARHMDTDSFFFLAMRYSNFQAEKTIVDINLRLSKFFVILPAKTLFHVYTIMLECST